MLMRLSKNTFVRQFGPFTYVIGRINAFDQMFRDAEPFFRWLTREPIEKDELLTIKLFCAARAWRNWMRRKNRSLMMSSIQRRWIRMCRSHRKRRSRLCRRRCWAIGFANIRRYSPCRLTLRKRVQRDVYIAISQNTILSI